MPIHHSFCGRLCLHMQQHEHRDWHGGQSVYKKLVAMYPSDVQCSAGKLHITPSLAHIKTTFVIDWQIHVGEVVIAISSFLQHVKVPDSIELRESAVVNCKYLP